LPFFDLIKDNCVENMHMMFLGIVKKIFSHWVTKHELDLKALDSYVEDLDLRMHSSMQNFVGCSFDEFKSWKAKNWKYFLIYVSPLLLESGPLSMLSQPEKNMWNLLIEICTTAGASEIPKNMLEELHAKCLKFVELAEKLLEKMSTINFHMVTHITEDLKLHGAWYTHSAFPYESHHHYFGKKVNGVQPYPLKGIKLWQLSMIGDKVERTTKNNIVGHLHYHTTASAVVSNSTKDYPYFYDGGNRFETLKNTEKHQPNDSQVFIKTERDSFYAVIHRIYSIGDMKMYMKVCKLENPDTNGFWTRYSKTSEAEVELGANVKLVPAFIFNRENDPEWKCCHSTRFWQPTRLVGNLLESNLNAPNLEKKQEFIVLEQPPVNEMKMEVDDVKKEKNPAFVELTESSLSSSLSANCQLLFRNLKRYWGDIVINDYLEILKTKNEIMYLHSYWSLHSGDKFFQTKYFVERLKSFFATPNCAMIVPVNLECHWSCAVFWKLDNQRVVSTLLDSLSFASHSLMWEKKLLPHFKKYSSTFTDCKTEFVKTILKSPQQPDGNSCGFFTCSFAKVVAENWKHFTLQENNGVASLQQSVDSLADLQQIRVLNQKKQEFLQQLWQQATT
jgi:hypothetical protein